MRSFFMPMKTTTFRIIMVVLVATAVALFAVGRYFSAHEPEPSARGPGNGLAGPNRGFERHDLASLEQFLTLNDEELDRLQEALARIRAIPEEERADFAGRIVEFRSLPREERQRLRDGWGRQSDHDREDWRRMMRELTPRERRAVHEALEGLSPAEHTERRREILEDWRSRQ